jgi:hypothetical protein
VYQDDETGAIEIVDIAASQDIASLAENWARVIREQGWFDKTVRIFGSW